MAKTKTRLLILLKGPHTYCDTCLTSQESLQCPRDLLLDRGPTTFELTTQTMFRIYIRVYLSPTGLSAYGVSVMSRAGLGRTQRPGGRTQGRRGHRGRDSARKLPRPGTVSCTSLPTIGTSPLPLLLKRGLRFSVPSTTLYLHKSLTPETGVL